MKHITWSKSIRKGRYRHVHYPREMFAEEYPDGFGELYDLEDDPWEMRNLFFEGEYRPLVEEMHRDLLDWLITTTRPATVLPKVFSMGDQVVTRYLNTVNYDGKIHPNHLRQLPGKNYL